MSVPTNSKQFHEHVREQSQYVQKLVDAEVTEGEFYEKFLRSMVKALRAEAGAVWLHDLQSLGLPAADIGLSSIGLFESIKSQSINRTLVSSVIATGESKSVGPNEDIPRPTKHVILLVGLHDGEKFAGALELFLRSNTTPSEQRGLLKFLEQMAGLVSRFLERQRQLPSEMSDAEFTNQLQEFTRVLHLSLDVKQVTATAVNDGSVILNCDRISLALRHGPKRARIYSVNGQESINHRAILIQRLAAVAAEVMKYGEPLTYDGHVATFPDLIEQLLANLLQESGSRMVHFVPLFAPHSLDLRVDADQEYGQLSSTRSVIGCLVLEQFSSSRPSRTLIERAELVAAHVASAVHNARSYEGLFLLPVWRFLGRLNVWFRGRNLAKTVAYLAATSAAIFSLVFIPWEYRVEGEGQLMPVVQRAVFAPWDGEVEEVFVGGGEHVEKEAMLVQLRNEEQHTELTQARNEINEKVKELLALQAELDRAVESADRREATHLQGRIAQTQVEITGLREQAQILEKRETSLAVRAPISGIIAEFQLELMLSDRPVARGEKLLDIMNDQGLWHVELQIPEKRLGHILQAQQNQTSGELPVEFILATAPEETFPGRLVKLATRSEISETGASVVEGVVAIDDDLPKRRIGATVRAKIACGKQSLGYVLFGDVLEFIERRLWW